MRFNFNKGKSSEISPKRVIKVLSFTLLFVIVLFNALAWMHARSMTHFVSSGDRTAKPEALSFTRKAWTILTGVKIPKPVNLRTPEDIGLAYDTHEIKDSGDSSLEAWSIPHANPKGLVIMFHGYAACKSDLLLPAAEFHKMGYDLFLIDFRGSGGSTGQETSIGFNEGKDVAQAVRFVNNQWPDRRIILYGVSMGSAAILRAIAFEAVHADAVIIESPFDSLLHTVGNRFKIMGLPGFPAARLLVFWGGVQQGFNGFKHNPVDYAKSVNCPVLLMHEERDTRATPDQAKTVFDNLCGEKRFVIFPDVSHEILAGAQPDKWRAEVTKFLTK
jgi:alpha-beta hydrolase superfamily lysophospholipase